MKINVKKLDETIAKLQELRRLATDPALSSFVVVTGRNNSNGSSPYVESEPKGNGHGALRANVLAACKAISGNFSIKEVFTTMKAQGYSPASDSAEKSVGNMLRALAVGGEIKIAVQGKGRRATAYSNT
jgi:hypothetical protein